MHCLFIHPCPADSSTPDPWHLSDPQTCALCKASRDFYSICLIRVSNAFLLNFNCVTFDTFPCNDTWIQFYDMYLMCSHAILHYSGFSFETSFLYAGKCKIFMIGNRACKTFSWVGVWKLKPIFLLSVFLFHHSIVVAILFASCYFTTQTLTLKLL